MNQEWYYAKGGKGRRGPVSANELRSLAGSGQIHPSDLVWKEGMREWAEARKIKALFSDAAIMPPPTAGVSATPPSAQTIHSGLISSRTIPGQAKDRWQSYGWRQRSVVLIGLLIPIIGGIRGCAQSGNSTIKLVKNGFLIEFPGTPIGKAVDSFLSNPNWESGTTQAGQVFVNVHGGMAFHGKPVRATIQFLVNKEAETFEFHAFELNGIPQNDLMKAALIQRVLEEYRQ